VLSWGMREKTFQAGTSKIGGVPRRLTPWAATTLILIFRTGGFGKLHGSYTGSHISK
jgi:hypothetical protein